MAATSPCRYSSGSREKVPLAMRNSSRLASVRPGFTTSSGRLVELHVAAVADDQPFVAVEHAQALRHVVDRDAHARIVHLHPPGDDNAGEQHRQNRRQAGEEGRYQEFGRRGDPGAERHDVVEQGEARRKACAADQRDETPIARDFRCGRSFGHARVRVGGHAIPLPVVLQLIGCRRVVKQRLTAKSGRTVDGEVARGRMPRIHQGGG